MQILWGCVLSSQSCFFFFLALKPELCGWFQEGGGVP